MVSSALLMALSMLSLGVTVQFKEMLILQKNQSIAHNSSENGLDRVKRHFNDLEMDFDLQLIDNKTADFFDLETFYENLKLSNISNDLKSALEAISNDLDRQNASGNKPDIFAELTSRVVKRDINEDLNDLERNDDDDHEIVTFIFYIFKFVITH
jgi:hypothetical protein